MSSKVMKKIIFDVRPGELLKEYGIVGLSKILSNLKSTGGVCFQTMQDDILSGGDIYKLPHDKITHVIDFIIEKEDHLEVHINLWKDFDDDTIKKFQLYLSGLVNIYHVYNPDNWIFVRLSLEDATKTNPFIISTIKEIVHLNKICTDDAYEKPKRVDDHFFINIANVVIKKLVGESTKDCIWTIYSINLNNDAIGFDVNLRKRYPLRGMNQYHLQVQLTYDGVLVSLRTSSEYDIKEIFIISHNDILVTSDSADNGYQTFYWPHLTVKSFLGDITLKDILSEYFDSSLFNDSAMSDQLSKPPLSTHSRKTTSYTLTVDDQSGKKEVFSLNVEKDTEIVVDDEDRTISFNVTFKEV